MSEQHTVPDNPYLIFNEQALYPPRRLKYKVRRRWITSVILILSLIGFFTAGVLLAAAYYPENFSFIPPNIRQTANRWLLRTPLPRNTEQILIGMLTNPKSHTKFNQQVFWEASARLDHSSAVSSNTQEGSLGLRMEGAVDATDRKNPVLDQTVSGLFEFSNIGNYYSSVDLRVINRDVYFKINYLPAALTQSLSSFSEIGVSNQWYKIGRNEYPGDKVFDGNLLKLLMFKKQASGLVASGKTYEYQSFVRNLGVEFIDLDKVYHLRVLGQEPEFKRFLIDFMLANRDVLSLASQDLADLEQDYENYVKELKLDLWIDTQDYTLRRVLVDIDLNISALKLQNPAAVDSQGDNLVESLDIQRYLDQIFLSSWKMRFGWGVTDVGSIEAINPPVESKPYQELISAVYTSFFGESLNIAYDIQVKQDVATIAAGLEEFVTFHRDVYPDRLDELVDAGVLRSIPKDPVNQPYIYLSSGDRAIVVGILYSPGEAERPYWLYDTVGGDTKAVTWSEYRGYRDQFQQNVSIESTLEVGDAAFNVYGAREVDFNQKVKAIESRLFDLVVAAL